MAQIKITVPRITYEKFSKRFTSDKAAKDYLEVKLDNLLRRERKRMKQIYEDPDANVELDLYIVDPLIPVLEEYTRIKRKPLRTILFRFMQNLV